MTGKSDSKNKIAQAASGEVLNAIQRDLVTSLSAVRDLQSGLRLCFEAAIKASGLDCGGIYLFDNNTGALDLVYHQGVSPLFLEHVAHYEADSSNVKLLKQGKPIYVNYDEFSSKYVDYVAAEKLRAAAIIPVVYKDAIIGGMNIASHYVTDIRSDIRSVLETIAALIGGALARLRAENALKESEELVRSVFDSSPDSITLINFEGTLVDCNPAALKLFGYPEDSNLKGISIFQHVVESQRNSVVSNIRETIKKGILQNIEYDLIRRDGSVFSAELSGSVVYDASNEPAAIIVITKDISERRATEKLLRDKELHLRNIIDSAPFGAHLYELHNNDKLIFTGSNKSANNILGIDHSSLIGKTIEEAFPLLKGTPVLEEYRRVALSGVQFDTEQINYSDRQVNGAFEVHAIQMGPNKMAAFFRDITERKQTEEKLRQSEERYRKTFENIGASTALINENRIILMVNSEFERLTGYSRDEIENIKSWTEFVYPEDLARMLKQHRLRERNRKAALPQYEFRLITKSGDIRDIFLTVDKIPGTKDTITSLIDITERKRAEQALCLSEEKFAKAFKVNPAALAITRMKDGQIVECNNSVTTLLGYEIEEVVGKTTAELNVWINKEDRDRMIAALNSGEPVHNWEVQFRAKDGSTKITQYSADILTLNNEQFILATFIDLTEMKHAQDALIESKLRYQELFELLMEGIALLNESGDIIFCNPAFLDIHEASSMEQIIGNNIREFLVGPDSEIDRNIRESWSKGINSQAEIEILTAKGNKKTILASGTPRLDTDKKLTGVIVAMIDITESKRLREFASYAQRLEAAGKIAGQVAHDFNNLLAPMVAYPELIKSAIPEDAFVLGMVNDIETAAKAMADINQQLLTLSRRGHYNLEVINLNDVINHAINQNSHSLESIDLITDFDPGLMNIKGGGAQILRIVSNLIANALDAMPEKGRLTIKTENYYSHKRSGITGIIPKGEYCKVSISDTGCGIAEDVIPKIFDAFFTTKVADKKRGSGLGLSVVHAVMEDHQGYIDLESKVGKGTTFYLYFPITSDVVESTNSNELQGGSESILIIDDDTLQRNVNTHLLNRLGYKIETVDNGENALALLKRKTFDLLIIDMIMPGGMDGTETYRKSLEINPKQKALIISGFAETDRVKEATALGAGAFLKKPLSMKVLAVAIRQELDRHPEKPTPLPGSVGTAH